MGEGRMISHSAHIHCRRQCLVGCTWCGNYHSSEDRLQSSSGCENTAISFFDLQCINNIFTILPQDWNMHICVLGHLLEMRSCRVAQLGLTLYLPGLNFPHSEFLSMNHIVWSQIQNLGFVMFQCERKTMALAEWESNSVRQVQKTITALSEWGLSVAIRKAENLAEHQELCTQPLLKEVWSSHRTRVILL